ncbi:MAG: c-type cytochrome, partial [Deltaproteobacteria bacterium]|nr:c-type cytochrome [Deltaproteobacteria bacterium]
AGDGCSATCTTEGGGGPSATNGAALYTSKSCSSCHGANGAGVGSFPPVQGSNAAELQTACDGTGTMNSAVCGSGQLSSSDIADLGAYLATL